MLLLGEQVQKDQAHLTATEIVRRTKRWLRPWGPRRSWWQVSGYLVNSFYLCVVQRIEKSGEGLVSLASRKGRLTWVAISFYQNEHWEKRKAEHKAHATRKQGFSRASVKISMVQKACHRHLLLLPLGTSNCELFISLISVYHKRHAELSTCWEISPLFFLANRFPTLSNQNDRKWPEIWIIR